MHRVPYVPQLAGLVNDEFTTRLRELNMVFARRGVTFIHRWTVTVSAKVSRQLSPLNRSTVHTLDVDKESRLTLDIESTSGSIADAGIKWRPQMRAYTYMHTNTCVHSLVQKITHMAHNRSSIYTDTTCTLPHDGNHSRCRGLPCDDCGGLMERTAS